MTRPFGAPLFRGARDDGYMTKCERCGGFIQGVIMVETDVDGRKWRVCSPCSKAIFEEHPIGRLVNIEVHEGARARVKRKYKSGQLRVMLLDQPWAMLTIKTTQFAHEHVFRQIEGQSSTQCVCGAVPDYYETGR